MPSVYLPGGSGYSSLTFYAHSDPSDTKYIQDITYKAGVYIHGNKIEVDNVTIDLSNAGWVKFEADDYVLIESNFESTSESKLEIQ